MLWQNVKDFAILYIVMLLDPYQDVSQLLVPDRLGFGV